MTTNDPKGRWEFDPNGSYRYRGRRPAKGGSADNGWHWLLIVLGLVAFWPLGLALLFLQLSGKWPGGKQSQTSAPRQTPAGADPAPANAQSSISHGRTTAQIQQRLAQERAARSGTSKSAPKKQQSDPGAPYGLGHVRLLRWVGGLITGIFGFALIMQAIDELTYFYRLGYFLESTLPLLALTLIGVTLLTMAGSRRRKLSRFQKYRRMVGSRTSCTIASLAEAMGVSESRAQKDLEEMLTRGFWEKGYVDAARRMLVLDGSLADAPVSPKKDDAAESAPDDTAAATLRHIRALNDAIADQPMSDKIDRIEELTRKIFQLVEEQPEKAGELRSFMNYYLPQTLKILERYAQLEAQGIEGENITQAKARIEATMDKMVDGYEAQLDKLFADDVLDISADLKVMERMMEKDGLTTDNELRL